MKKLLKVLKWTGIILVVIVLGVGVLTASRQHVKYESPYPHIKASKDSTVIARGRHLANAIAHCSDCHGPWTADSLANLGQEPVLSGGFAFNIPLGTIYSANITSDSVYGIGAKSDAEIARVLRNGVRTNGTAAYDFMPFHNLSDEDLTAVISYLRTQKPAAVKVPEHQLNAMGKMVNAFLVKPVGPSEPVAVSVKPDTSAAYGKYLALNVANCSGCHTQRDMSGAFSGELLAGGGLMEGLVPPNITTDSSSRIFGWTQEAFINRFRMGKVIPNSIMPWNSFKKMTDDELKAIYNFLKTVKPAKTKPVA